MDPSVSSRSPQRLTSESERPQSVLIQTSSSHPPSLLSLQPEKISVPATILHSSEISEALRAFPRQTAIDPQVDNLQRHNEELQLKNEELQRRLLKQEAIIQGLFPSFSLLFPSFSRLLFSLLVAVAIILSPPPFHPPLRLAALQRKKDDEDNLVHVKGKRKDREHERKDEERVLPVIHIPSTECDDPADLASTIMHAPSCKSSASHEYSFFLFLFFLLIIRNLRLGFPKQVFCTPFATSLR
jgi:hypothetical protein